MIAIKVAPEVSSSRMLAEGAVERWLVSDGSLVSAGEPVAAIRIGEYRYEVGAPAEGQLFIDVFANDPVGPGTTIGRISIMPIAEL